MVKCGLSFVCLCEVKCRLWQNDMKEKKNKHKEMKIDVELFVVEQNDEKT